MAEDKIGAPPGAFEEMERIRDWIHGHENDLALGLTLEGTTYDELDKDRAQVLEMEKELLKQYATQQIAAWRTKREALKQARLFVYDLRAGDQAYEFLLRAVKRNLEIAGAKLADIGTSEAELLKLEKLGRGILIDRLTKNLTFIILGLNDGDIVRAANRLAKEWNKVGANPVKEDGLPVTDYDVVKHIQNDYDPRFIYKTMVIDITIEAVNQTITIH
jgi:hypothetical protein